MSYTSSSPNRWVGALRMFDREYSTEKEVLFPLCRPVSQVPGEIRGFLSRAECMLSIAESSLSDVSLQDTDAPGFRRYIKHVPLGVVFVISPWK